MIVVVYWYCSERFASFITLSVIHALGALHSKFKKNCQERFVWPLNKLLGTFLRFYALHNKWRAVPSHF